MENIRASDLASGISTEPSHQRTKANNVKSNTNDKKARPDINESNHRASAHIKKKIRLRSDKRIGPHNFDILSILFGSLLGDCHAEYRNKGKGTRFTFYQE